jgi:hypothetical protein
MIFLFILGAIGPAKPQNYKVNSPVCAPYRLIVITLAGRQRPAKILEQKWILPRPPLSSSLKSISRRQKIIIYLIVYALFF